MPSPQPVLFLMLPGRRSMGRNVPFLLPMFLKAMCPHEVYPDVHLTFGRRLISLCFWQPIERRCQVKNGEVSPQDDSTDSIFKKKKHCLHLCPLFTQLQWGDTVLPCAGSTNIPSREHKNLQTYKYPSLSEDIYEQVKRKTGTLKEYGPQQGRPLKGGKNEILLGRDFKNLKPQESFLTHSYSQPVSQHCYISLSCCPFVCLLTFEPAQPLVEDSIACLKTFAWKASLQNY